MGFVGTKIYGYCNGYFGRDDYDDKIIILEGRTWIVCAYLSTYSNRSDHVTCVNFDSEEEKVECIKRWSEKPVDWDDED